jgi:hypothetical protein
MTDEERMQEDIVAGIIIPNGMKQVIFIIMFVPIHQCAFSTYFFLLLIMSTFFLF